MTIGDACPGSTALGSMRRYPRPRVHGDGVSRRFAGDDPNLGPGEPSDVDELRAVTGNDKAVEFCPRNAGCRLEKDVASTAEQLGDCLAGVLANPNLDVLSEEVF